MSFIAIWNTVSVVVEKEDDNRKAVGNDITVSGTVYGMGLAELKGVITVESAAYYKIKSVTSMGITANFNVQLQIENHKPVIVIDPGHGDKYLEKDGTRNKYLDSGTLSHDKKVAEKDITLNIAKKVQPALRSLMTSQALCSRSFQTRKNIKIQSLETLNSEDFFYLYKIFFTFKSSFHSSIKNIC